VREGEIVGLTPDLAAVHSIAVLRANAMGDYLHSEPALAALREAAPQARITLLGGPWAAAALPGRPGPVDEVVLLPQLRPDDPALRDRHFDLAIQMHGGGRNSNLVVSALGAGFTAGFQAADAPPLDLTIAYQYWQHEVFRYLELAAALGAPAVRVQPHFFVVEAELAAADRVLGAAGVTGPFAVIHPGATDPRRRWPPAHFARVARALQNQGVPVVVVGSEGDIVAEVGERAAAQPLLDLVFGELVGLLARASILVGNDSGPRHLADALGTPTVAVYWCGNMVNAAPVARRNHRAHISWTTACPICGCSLVGEPFPLRCSDNVSLVSEVPVDAVVSSTLALLEADGVLTARAWTEVGP